MFVIKRGRSCQLITTLLSEPLKPLRKRKTFPPQKINRIHWESLADKEVRTAFADNIASKFKELPASTEDMESE